MVRGTGSRMGGINMVKIKQKNHKTKKEKRYSPNQPDQTQRPQCNAIYFKKGKKETETGKKQRAQKERRKNKKKTNKTKQNRTKK